MSSKQNIVGFLDDVTNTRIYGWALVQNQETAVAITLKFNDQEIITLLAQVLRHDVVDAGLHPTGYCGFDLDLQKEGIELPPNCKVQVYAGEAQVELVNSPWFYYSDAYLAEIQEETAVIKFDEDDKKILILGMGKSGTSILTYRIADVDANIKVYFEPYTTQCLNHIEFHRKIYRKYDSYITKALYYPQYPQQLALVGGYYNKKVCIIRDPRDLLISTFFYSWNKSDNPPHDKFPAALKLVLQKEKEPQAVDFTTLLAIRPEVPTSILDSVQNLCDLTNNLGEDWHILKYEDFVTNKVTGLNAYLGFPINLEASVPGQLKRVERSKKFDNWRRWFTENDVQHLKPQLDNYLACLNYDPDDWTLAANPQLSPSEGSEYMTKIFAPPPKKGLDALKNALASSSLGKRFRNL